MMRMRGFSLLEMMLVLVLIAVAGVLALAAFSGSMRGMQLRSAAKEVAAQLRFAHVLAISSGQAQDVIIDPAARRWRAPKGRSGALPTAAEVSFVGARGKQLGLAGSADGEAGVVRFFPDGAATGGRLRLQIADAGWDVDVRWLTGEVQVQRMQGAQ